METAARMAAAETARDAAFSSSAGGGGGGGVLFPSSGFGGQVNVTVSPYES